MFLSKDQLDELFSRSDSMNRDEYEEMLKCLDTIYYNEPKEVEYILSDEIYDYLIDKFEKRFKIKYESIGADVSSKEIIDLPFYLGSMDKYKSENDNLINKWKTNFESPYIIEEKLDGVSALYYNNNLYTRGNGYQGTIITNLLKIIKLPKIKSDIAIRGELIMKKDIFSEKFSKKYKNARNLVSGIVNSKSVNKTVASKIDFIAYEIINPPNLKPSRQLEMLEQLGFNVVKYEEVKKISVDILNGLLEKFRNSSLYEIDGIIVNSNHSYKRNTSGNPEYAFAFKNLRNVIPTRVIDVEWEISRYGIIKPTIIVEPVNILGSTISRATGFNAKFIKDNNIGKDTIVNITKSGDVIPYIVGVVNSTKASFPKNIDYRWNETEVDIFTEVESTEQIVNILKHFFSTMGVKGVAVKTLEKLVKNNYNTIDKIINISKEDLENIGFGKKESENIYNSIHSSLKNVDLSLLMSSTPYFGQGLGHKKIKLIIKEYPDILTQINSKKLVEKISKISGWSEKSAQQFVNGLEPFKDFLDRNNIVSVESAKLIEKSNTQSNKESRFKDLKIVFTGFRDQNLEKIIEDEGGKLVNTVSKGTNVVVAKNVQEDTTKLNKAREFNIKILSVDEFKKEYNL